MVSDQVVQAKITALEEALRQTAFEVLNESRAYDQAGKLLRLAESLKDLENEFVKIMHPSAATEEDEDCRWWGKAFPRFCVRNDRLVKEGKGKKSPMPYTQEVDRGGFDVVVNWIGAHDREAWLMGQMVKDLAAEVAGYKPYVVSGALAEAGLLRKVKRGSYRAADLVSADDWWSVLAAGPQAPVDGVDSDDEPSPLEGEDIPF